VIMQVSTCITHSAMTSTSSYNHFMRRNSNIAHDRHRSRQWLAITIWNIL